MKDTFFYLYVNLDIYSRKIVCWKIYAAETAELAAELIKKAVWVEIALRCLWFCTPTAGAPSRDISCGNTLSGEE